MKILITGAAGFIGSHAAERLCSLGHEVIGVDFFSDFNGTHAKKLNAGNLEGQGVRVLGMNLTHPESYALLPVNFDYIFHFAAQCGLSSTVSFDNYIQNNIIATECLLEFALLNKQLQMFIHISSSSVYGKEAIVNEDSIPQPISSYGVSKLAAEQLVLSRFRAGQLPACVLRLYSVYGPRERADKLYTRLIYAGLSGNSFTLYEGSEKHLRSFSYVDDIIDGIIMVMDNSKPCNGEIINLGSDLAYSTQQGISYVELILGKNIDIKTLPARTGDQTNTKADISKAKSIVNYTPKISLQDGLHKQIIWCRENINILKNSCF